LYSKQHIVSGLDLVAQYVVPYCQKVRGRRRIATLSEIVQHIVVVTVRILDQSVHLPGSFVESRLTRLMENDMVEGVFAPLDVLQRLDNMHR
jgi:hypothetical protein